MAHEALGNGKSGAAAYRLVARAKHLEIVADARVKVGAVAASHRPNQRIDRDDAAAAQIFRTFERDTRGLFPFEAVFGLELHAGYHCRVDVAATPVTHRGLQRFDPSLIAHIAIL